MRHSLSAYLIAVAVAAASSAAISPVEAAPRSDARGGCAQHLLTKSQPAGAVAKRDAAAFRAAAATNGKSRAEFRAQAKDDTFWLDRCGRGFFVEPEATARQKQRSAAEAVAPEGAATSLPPLSETFNLESKPGSQRTIYLDFRGGTIPSSAWSSSPINYEAYSQTAPADTAYTDAELTQIQKVWQYVAEDYAPFDVNVTTRDLGVGAIDRTSSGDLVYGTRVVVTKGGPLYADCGCGGIAYVNVFNMSGSNHMWYQPAWVFTDGVGTGAKNIAEAASHEAGHNLGLSHDGTPSSGYYSGADPWAPIMGVGYYQPVSQWSRGEYPGANQFQDDLAILATGIPVRSDDVGNSAPSAQPLASGVPFDGLITTRTDVDAFTFTGSGETTVSVTPAEGLPNLDIKLTVVDSGGATVATIDPLSAKVNAALATGMNASWSATLPAGGATYTLLVDGIGTGDPATAGRYSDYGSLGNYQISLSTGFANQPLTATAGSPPNGTVGTSYSATPVSASGGTAPYSYSASGLPAGLSIAPSTGVVSGTPSAAGSFSVTVTVTDAASATASATTTITINAAPTPPITVPAQTVNVKANQTFSAQLVATGGTGPYTWSVVSGLPSGVSLSPSGVLSGKVAKPGAFSITVRATSGSSTGTGVITLKSSKK